MTTVRDKPASPDAVGRGTFRALQIPGFRRYFIGQLASMCGTWAQTVAVAWLVLRLTGSGTRVGLLTAAQFVPVVLLSAWAGAMADRFDERRSVIAVQLLLGIQATVLAVIVVTDVVQVWMLYPLAVVQGVGVAFDTPTRQSLVGRIVGNEDLRNALSLNASLVQVARVVGPTVAGVLIETVGIGICFVINAVSYAVVIAAVSAIEVQPHEHSSRSASAAGQVMDGIRTVWRTPDLRVLITLALFVSLVAVNFTVALPVVVRDRFGDRAGTFAALMAVYGCGALAGAYRSATRPPTKRLLVVAATVLAAALLVCTQQSHLAVLVPGVAAAGFVGLTLGVTVNASLQLGAPPSMRGRVIGLYFLVAFGSNVAAGPLIGWLAESGSTRASFAISAAAMGIAAARLAFLWRGRLDELPAAPANSP